MCQYSDGGPSCDEWRPVDLWIQYIYFGLQSLNVSEMCVYVMGACGPRPRSCQPHPPYCMWESRVSFQREVNLIDMASPVSPVHLRTARLCTCPR